ncbi:Fic family protein [Mucilaginibacter myungsuensis]|uniref:Fic family protein n=2 Tax=Mucilaginibacter myungsuensis TaxID=649104 RepID=A0A929KYE8_9SPHI|nr:Fic family protein [Mucilaginibacter myungsuensis]
MNDLQLEILPTELLNEFLSTFDTDLRLKFDALQDSELSADTFSFYTSVSAVFSSKIEGEPIELDSYIKHKKLGVKFLPDYTQKIDDLYDAYRVAKANPLNASTVTEAHTLLTKHILQKSQRGKTRTGNMFVMTPDGKIEYIACLPQNVPTELAKFYRDVAKLIDAELSFAETFFFASLIHLIFVKIHPFEDGNGRTARLLEKWFLAQKLGEKAWFVQSEKFYYDHHEAYYANIRRMGLEYEVLDYDKVGEFLGMLQQTLNT